MKPQNNNDLKRRAQEEINDLRRMYKDMEPVSGLERDYMMGLRRRYELLEDMLEELTDYEYTFDLQGKASRRATKLWLDYHPDSREIWPDRTDLIVWLMQRNYDICELLNVALNGLEELSRGHDFAGTKLDLAAYAQGLQSHITEEWNKIHAGHVNKS